MYRLLILLSSIYLIGSVYIHVFPLAYVSELGISFLPYLMRGGYMGCVVVFIFFIMEQKRWRKYSLFVCLFGLALLGSIYSKTYTSFYHNDTGIEIDTAGEGLTFLYANIRYKNTHTQELYDVIMEREPDLVFFVEYTPEHHAALYHKLEDSYPYINTAYPDVGPAGKVIYSKYPFENLAPTLSGSAAWKYGYISLEHNNQEYIFYLVHTSAPVSRVFYNMRNRQLATLEEDIVAHHDVTRYESIVTIMGDFNVSPWSPAYADLSQAWGIFENVTRFLPGVMTWSLPGGRIRSHIDHIWVNIPEHIGGLEQIPLTGSDHDAFFGKITYKKDK